MSATEEKNKGKQGGGANTKNPQTDEHKGKKGAHNRKSKYAKESKN
ncbi:hypothetical protein [Halocola ammonii]